MKYNLTIEYKKFVGREKRNVGVCIKVSDRKFLIKIDKDEPILKRVGTLFHELGHFLFWTLFEEGSTDLEREHKFCDDVDTAAVRAMKRFLGATKSKK